MLTQVGGGVFLLAKLIFRKAQPFFSKRIPLFFQKAVTFLLLYFVITFLVIPPLAIFNNRVPLPYFATKKALQPANLMTVFLNRHYVRPQLKQLTEKIADQISLKYAGSCVLYLDANFPFWNGFPLLPHISHNDGRKIDLSFFYKHQKTGDFINERLTFTGYGFCEEPQKGEINQPAICKRKGHWQYSLLQKFVNKNNYSNIVFDRKRNQDFLKIMATESKTGKILIEPHLKHRLHLSNLRKVRYHGCHAVRHDDHIHLQL